MSSEVLAAVSGALRLNDDERRYLFDLASAARGQGRPRADRRDIAVPAAMQWALDSITLSSAFIRTGRTDIVASNAVARALFAPMFRSETVDRAGRPNIARYAFLDPGARRFFVDWEAAGSSTVALLRAEIARDPGDRPLRDLVRELSAGSEAFRSHWKAHDVLMRHDGLKHLDHPHVGNLELAFQSLDLHLPEGGVRQLVLYTAEPGTLSDDRLKLLAIIAASELGPGRPGAGTPGDAQISIASDEIG
ncbi:MmyB family transcriptional regulator [Leifsonia xyli]|uniref:MmyB family transcriptional regulator n=1 Tax=Leifsonia xyli TaxID=1575 RepID=UPI003D66CBA5